MVLSCDLLPNRVLACRLARLPSRLPAASIPLPSRSPAASIPLIRTHSRHHKHASTTVPMMASNSDREHAAVPRRRRPPVGDTDTIVDTIENRTASMPSTLPPPLPPPLPGDTTHSLTSPRGKRRTREHTADDREDDDDVPFCADDGVQHELNDLHDHGHGRQSQTQWNAYATASSTSAPLQSPRHRTVRQRPSPREDVAHVADSHHQQYAANGIDHPVPMANRAPASHIDDDDRTRPPTNPIQRFAAATSPLDGHVEDGGAMKEDAAAQVVAHRSAYSSVNALLKSAHLHRVMNRRGGEGG